MAVISAVNQLKGDARLAWAEPNFYQDWQKFFTPNDPRFANQWHLNNTGQSGGLVDADSDLPEAWDVIQGGSTDYTIGVIDDGVVTNHPDLTVWVNPGEIAGDGIDNDGNGWVDDVNGWNFVSNNNQSTNIDATDEHGTSVAGVAAAKGNNGLGVAGASYNSKVLSAKIFQGTAVASDANIASALYYAAGRKANGSGTWKAADVLNNSWGGGASSSVINAALTWATTSGRQGKGAPVFIASGNEFGAVSEPALQSLNIPGVFAVGAINNKGEKSDYSNFGPAVDLVTPSSDSRSGYLAIDTTDRVGSAGYDPSDYTGTGANGFGGTSSATPLASGIAALTLARADQLGVTLTPAQLRSYLRNNTDIVGASAYSMSTGRNDNMGWGRLNAASAVSNLNKPEISVISTTTDLVSGTSNVDFGTTVVNGTIDVTLRIRNQGTLPLTLSGVSVSGASFTVQSAPASTTLALGAATTFVLRYAPTAAGPFNGTVTIGSNDSDEGSFTFTVSGTTGTASSTGLGLGDIAFTGLQTASPDEISFVALKTIASGTTLTITDNAWTGSALATTEGNSVITFGTTFAAGTVFNFDASRTAGSRWAVGTSTTGLSDVTGANFALANAGDNLFAYLGTTAPTSATDPAWIAAFATNSFVSSGATSNLTLLPSVFTTGDNAFALGLTTSAQNGVMTTPANVSGTPAQIRSVINTLSNWTIYAGTTAAPTIPGNVVFTVGTGTETNNAPTALTLSSTSIAENAGANATVGTFTTTDPDSGNTFTYSLVTGSGSTDNASFNISGNTLRATASFDFETKNVYNIRVRTTDQGGLFFEQTFTINVTDVFEPLSVKLNELKVNPPGSSAGGDKYQYIELLGTPGESLTNVYLVMLDGNGANVGTANYVASLNGRALGSNGLLMIKSPTGGHTPAAGTTVVTDSQFDTAGGILSKQTVSFYLVSSTTPIVQGTDFDANNDGVLDNVPSGFNVLDNVGWTDGDAGDRVYGGVALTQTQGTPDAATRIVGTTNTAVAAWFNGDLYDVGNDPTQLVYDATRGSSNLPVSPVVASLTPGDVNFAPAATSGALRVVSYNIASSAGTPRGGLSTILQAIGTEIVSGLSRPIDLLALQEVESQATTSTIVAGLLNAAYSTVAYVASTLDGASTGSGTQGFVYNTQTLSLLEETAVGTVSTSGQPRQTVRAKFRPAGTLGTSDFYVFNSHFKSADTTADEARRLTEAQAIRASADALGEGANILYVGDFNLYKATDPSFVHLTSTGNGQAFDPINRVGSWSGSSSFVDVFTQAPSSAPPSGLTGGGLDDRFDFQLITGELRDGVGLDYRTGSYRAFGNNGSVPVNGNINSPSSTALGGLANRTTVLDLLTTVSDHLPVVADYIFTTTTSVNQAPNGADKTIAQNEDSTYTYTTGDFGFSDTNNPANTLLAVKVSTLPAKGSLRLNNTAVTAGQFIPASSIAAGGLQFIPTANENGSPYTTWTFQVQDNGGTAGGGIDLDPTPNTVTINVISVNDAPVVSTSSGSAAFTGVGQVVVDAAISVTDIDSNIASASVSITGNFVAAEDQLAFTAASGITGSYNSTTGVLSLTGSATPAAYQSVLRTVTYANSNANASTATRTISFQVNDGSSANANSNVATRSVTVSTTAAQTLTVSTFAPKASGVDMTFSRPININNINLYDQGGTLGAPDVILVGTTTGPVRGSLIFNPTNTGFTFVKTGALTTDTNSPGSVPGTLAPDTYTLTLRSNATDGFVDTSGNALRDASGNVSNYVQTFTIAPPAANALTISIPDFARGFSQAVNVPNTSTGLPVVLSAANNVSVVDFTVAYDPTLLTITGFTSNSPGASAVVNVSTPGVARVSIVSTTSLTTATGAFILGTFNASVPANAPYGAKQLIRFTKVDITDASPASNAIPVIADDAVHIASFIGDTSGNQVYGGNDALLVQRAVVGSNTGYSAFQMLDPFIISDISHNMDLGGNDALFVQRAVVNTPVPNIPDLPSGIVATPPTGVDPRLFIPTDLTAAVDVDAATAGIQIDIPVRMLVTEAAGVILSGVDFAIGYDTTKLTINSVTAGPLLTGANLANAGSPFTGPTNIAGGIVSLSQFSTDGTVRFAFNTSGDLYRIRATVVSGATGSTRLNLRATGTALYDFNGNEMVLIPAPTNADTDAVDGLLQISAVANTPPTFGQASYSFSLPENSAQGTAVGTVSATDPDVGNTLVYSLSGTGSTNFSINSATGAITVAASADLNFEGTNVFNLTASVTDGTATVNAPVTISLTNVNERPTFNLASYSFSLPENSAQGTSVGTVAATDPDAGTTLVYSLSGTGASNFVINSSTGVITVAAGAVLNFEGTNTFNLTASATDGVTTPATAPVTISLTNVNESPTFNLASYSFSLPENSAQGTSVGTVAATDPDTGTTLVYSLSGTGASNFVINSSTGVITVAAGAVLNFEGTNTFNLTASATDGVTTPATAPVTISLTNVNERPTFNLASYSFSLPRTRLKALRWVQLPQRIPMQVQRWSIRSVALVPATL